MQPNISIARAALLLALLAPAGARAQSAQPGRDTLVVLEPLVVTAERERAAPPPVATVRVNPERVHATQAANTYDLFRRVAGMEVHEQGQGPGFASNAVIRGFTSDHSGDILLVVDGVPVNLPIHGHGEGYADWNTLLPAAVSSLRVIHGAASPLYGDFALGGVAEVFTAADADGTTGSISGSSYGDVSGYLLTGRRGTRGGSLAAAQLGRTEGWRDNSAYLLGNGLLRGWRRVGAGRLEGGLALYGTEWASPGFVSLADYNAGRTGHAIDPTDGGESGRVVGHGRYAVPLSARTSLQATAWGMASRWTLFLNVPEGGAPVAQSGEHDRRVGGGAQTEVVWTPEIGEFTLGASARADAAAYELGSAAGGRMQTMRVDVDARHDAGALYARWRRTFGGRLGVDLGGRVDVVRHATRDVGAAAWVADTRMVPSPKLGARYRVNDGLFLRASSSRGFRSSVGVLGDPGRPPILAWSHEIGADVARGPVEASFAVFRLDVSNERTVDPVTREISSAGTSARQGVDLDARVRVRRGLHAIGAATFNDARLTGSYADAHTDHGVVASANVIPATPSEGPSFHAGHDGEPSGEWVPGVARYTGRIGVEAERSQATARAVWRFTGPYVPIGEPEARSRPFSVLDLGASVPAGRGMRIDAELQNALDIRYAELRASGYVTPGAPRALRLGIRFNPEAF